MPTQPSTVCLYTSSAGYVYVFASADKEQRTIKIARTLPLRTIIYVYCEGFNQAFLSAHITGHTGFLNYSKNSFA